MGEQALISVIIPVYKAESYLPTCLDSVLGQTYRNLEIILVDDGSPDRSGAICNEYAAKDSRIRVIHQENEGLSAARNAGLGLAKGDYIGFVDSDDYIDPGMYKALYDCMQVTCADIVQCRHRGVSENGEELFVAPDATASVLDRRSALISFFTGPVQFICCSKLYRRELFQDVRFDRSFPVSEDIFLNYCLLKKVERVALIEDAYYNYVQHPFSLSNIYSKKCGMTDVTKAVLDDLRREYPDLIDYAKQTLCCQLIGIYEEAHPLLDRRARKEPKVCKTQRTWARRELKRELREFLHNPVAAGKSKRKAFLISAFPHLYPRLLHYWRRLRGIEI